MRQRSVNPEGDDMAGKVVWIDRYLRGRGRQQEARARVRGYKLMRAATIEARRKSKDLADHFRSLRK
jgi:hypothetical protein